jgi:hypothetical protein
MKYAALVLCSLLSACGVVSEQSFYEGIRANERAKSAGTGQDDKVLPNYDRYSKELEIQFFNPMFRLYQNDRKPLLQEFNLLSILAANPDAPLMPQVAWSVYLGMDRNLHRNRPREFLQVGAGKATSFGNSAARAYLLALADLGYEAKLGLHAGPGIRVGAVTPFFAETKIRVDTTLTRNFGLRSNETSIAGRAQLGKSFGQEFELNLLAERSNAESSFSILIHKYF